MEDTKGKGRVLSPLQMCSPLSLRERNIRLLLSQAGLLTMELCNHSYPSDIKKENQYSNTEAQI